MPENLHVDSQQSMTSLVSGIINDAQALIRQELTLARREIQDEWTKTKTAAASFGVGVAIAAIGGILLCIMLVHLLHWLTDGRLPLWGCYGIVGGLFTAVGGMMVYAGKSKANQIDFVPRQTVQSMKENVQWIKNQT